VTLVPATSQGLRSPPGVTIGTAVEMTAALFQLLLDDSNGATAFYVDDPTDTGTAYAVVQTHGNTLDDGTANAVASFHTTVNLEAIPTSDPGVHGQLYSVAGIVHISA